MKISDIYHYSKKTKKDLKQKYKMKLRAYASDEHVCQQPKV